MVRRERRVPFLLTRRALFSRQPIRPEIRQNRCLKPWIVNEDIRCLGSRASAGGSQPAVDPGTDWVPSDGRHDLRLDKSLPGREGTLVTVAKGTSRVDSNRGLVDLYFGLS